jgi:hypothetical protein
MNVRLCENKKEQTYGSSLNLKQYEYCDEITTNGSDIISGDIGIFVRGNFCKIPNWRPAEPLR